MGFGISNLFMLSNEGLLTKKNTSILDVGSQNLLNAPTDLIIKFLKRHGKAITNQEEFHKEVERISYFSYIRPGERTTYLSELIDLTDFKYTSYDICPALKTEILDLNHEKLPKKYYQAFDVVLNFGTTEHILNQLNCFELMHDAVALNGVIFHQLPSTGYVDHGYFAYHPQFFYDLAKINGFEIRSMYYTQCGSSNLSPLASGGIRNAERLDEIFEESSTITVPNYTLNVLLVKVKNQKFQLPLEIATSHSGVDAKISKKYEDASFNIYHNDKKTGFWGAVTEFLGFKKNISY
jgi:hypothetical protein